jgi:hypothetical protein
LRRSVALFFIVSHPPYRQISDDEYYDGIEELPLFYQWFCGVSHVSGYLTQGHAVDIGKERVPAGIAYLR